MAHVFRVQKLFERLGVVELHQDAALDRAIERILVARRLHAVLQPLLLHRLLHVHVLGAHLSAVRLAQGVEDVAQLRRHAAAQAAADEFAIEIPDRQAVKRRVELGMPMHRVLKRIEVRQQMAADSVGIDHL